MKGKLVDNRVTSLYVEDLTDDEIYNATWSTNIESIFKFSYKFGLKRLFLQERFTWQMLHSYMMKTMKMSVGNSNSIVI